VRIRRPHYDPAVSSVAARRVDVHEACLRMLADRLVVGSAGNISVRLDEEHVVVSAGGVPYRQLDADDHPVVSLADGSWTGPRPPTSELAVHLAIMRARPDVGAVVHTHSPHATAFAVARRPIEFVCNENLGAGAERILVTEPYEPPASAALGDAVLTTLAHQPGSRACLLANHGIVAIGDTLPAAYVVAQQVEWVAEICVYAERLGGAVVLTTEQQDAIAAAYGTTVARPR
jgi:L-fuculose-phosphate aldolase